MPTFTAEDRWTTVRRRGNRRGDRGFASDRRSPRRTSYPSRNRRRTYASVVRGRDYRDEREIPHVWQHNQRRERPTEDRYAAQHRDRTEREQRFERGRAQDTRGDRYFTSDRRSPRRTSYPSRNGRRTYASVVRGRDHREVREIPHTWQPNQQRWRTTADHHTARHRERRFEQRPAQNRRYVKHARSERSEPPTNKIPSDDPDFSIKVRIIHRLIKSVHHLKNVSRDAYPPSLNKIAQNLMTVVKPAVPSERTQALIEGNAQNWAHNTVSILREHYSEAMEEELKSLFEFPKQDWRGPFEVATSWAKRNLGRRLQPESLEQTEAVIVARLADTRSAERGHTAGKPRRQPEAREDLIQPDPVEPPVEVLQPASSHTRPATPQPSTSRAIKVTAQIHAPPVASAVTMVTATTMTDPIRGDWSPLTEGLVEENGDRRPTTTPQEDPPEPEPEPMSSKDQRVRRVLDALHVTPTGEKSPPPTQPPQPSENMEIEVMDLTQGESTPTKSKGGRRTAPKSPAASRSSLPRTTQDKLKSCVQTRLQTRRIEESSLSPPSSPGTPIQQTHPPTRHPNTQKKLEDWSLHIRETSLIMGDSNVCKLPSFSAPGIQIDSFPGAKWCHAQALLEKATCDEDLETLVLSFGLNNRSQRDKDTPVTELKKALQTAQERFPEADIYIPAINFSSTLPRNEQETLLHLNTFIAGLDEHIPTLPDSMFHTEKDNIHWTDKTAMCMLEHWSNYVNVVSP